MFFLAAFFAAVSSFGAVKDVYDFKLSLKVPRVYDNSESLGSRRYQTQALAGSVEVLHEDGYAVSIRVFNLKNKTHKIGGKPISYQCFEYPDSLYCHNLIGSNRTGVFSTASTSFGIMALPSYALTYAQEDNSLFLQLSGRGGVKRRKTANGAAVPYFVQGYVTGTIGCACSDYGHTSPTRVVGDDGASNLVSDTASVFGRWSMKFVRRETVKD